MTVSFLKKSILFILPVLIAVCGYLYIASAGSKYSCVLKDLPENIKITDVYVSPDSEGSVEILNWEDTGKGIKISLRSVAPGRTYIVFDGGDDTPMRIFYVHKNGVITADRFLGDCTGASAVIAAFMLYLIVLTGYFIKRYNECLKKSSYSYDNVQYMGLIIFTIVLTLTQAVPLFSRTGIRGAISSAVNSSQLFVTVTYPLVILTTVFVTISNVKLLKREGKTWKNMLAIFLGLLIGIAALLPFIVSSIMQKSTVIDVHYEKGIGRYAELFAVDLIASFVTYLECILLGTVINGIRTAIHIPKFDKDYILILGCQVRKDGSLTKLLQSRANRALVFAKMQKEKTGKDIIFVPSGGKGSDETVSEADAIKKYLVKWGVSESRILTENKSTNTDENFRFSMEKIRQHHGSDDFKVAFSTTNYHVFRSGMLAEKQGIKAEGIGSRTKSYYWVNAFVREFIATVIYEKTTHLAVAGVLFLINLVCVGMLYVSEAILA